MIASFTTIGHSNRSLEEFIAMLQAAEVTLLIDVRTFPRSRANPVFNIETFPAELDKVKVGYQHWPALGGRRSKQPQVNEELNQLWRVQAFHNYADYALSEEFMSAFHALVEVGQRQRVALMCSEAVWWRCHRRIITDYLLLNGHQVDHIMAKGRIDAARPTPGAQKTAAGHVIYPATDESLSVK